MTKSLINILATVSFAAAMFLSEPPQEINAVIYKNGHISNVPFTLGRPIVIAQSDVPAALMFTRDEHGKLIGVLYVIEKDYSLTEKQTFDPLTAPQHLFGTYNFAVTVFPQP